MARKRAFRVGVLLILVLAVAAGLYHLAGRIPDLVRQAESALSEEASRLGVRVSYGKLRIDPLHLRAVFEEFEARDEAAGLPLLRAESLDVSLSPARILTGRMPVSRIRIRGFTASFQEANLPLVDRIRARAGEGGGEEDDSPSLELRDGRVRVGPVGPVRRFEARIGEVQARPLRFLGTQVRGELAECAGEIGTPGGDPWGWPFPDLAADLILKDGGIRIRRLQASGGAATVRVSGTAQPGRRSGDLALSGTVDLAGWIRSSAPGAPNLARILEEGSLEFSGQVAGSLDDPAGSARLTLERGKFPAGIEASARADLRVAGRAIRLVSLEGALWEGTLSGEAGWDLAAGRGEGKVALRKVRLGRAPWERAGVDWRPAGFADLSLELKATPTRWEGRLDASNPSGIERPDPRGAAPDRIPVPLSLSVAASGEGDERVEIREIRVGAGGAMASGRAVVDLSGRSLEASGSYRVARGGVSEYGWTYPVSWDSLEGTWTANGPLSRPRIGADLRAAGLRARKLPPVAAAAKLEGDLRGLIHFVADVPSEVGAYTASGTVGGPLAEGPPVLSATVAARGIDLARAPRWTDAVLSSLDAGPADLERRFAGLSGTASADLEISVEGSRVELLGDVASAEARLPGGVLRALSGRGRLTDSREGLRWDAQLRLEVGGGVLEFSGRGEEAAASLSFRAERVEAGEVLSFADPAVARRVRGAASGHAVIALEGGVWTAREAMLEIPSLSVDGLPAEGVKLRGEMGAVSGELRLECSSPDLRLTLRPRRDAFGTVDFSAEGRKVPTGFLLAALGKADLPSGGTFGVQAQGTLLAENLRKPGRPLGSSIPKLTFRIVADGPAVSGLAFGSARAEGERSGEGFTGLLTTADPDSRLRFDLGLSPPYPFRLEGPFSFARRIAPEPASGSPPGSPGSAGKPARNGPAGRNGKDAVPENGPGSGYAAATEVEFSGRAEIAGALADASRSRGTLSVDRFSASRGGIRVAGEGVSILLRPEGIQWEKGAIRVDGSPLSVSGSATWAGAIDARVSGTLPASSLRMATDIFDRLDGTIRLNVRVGGRWDDPTLVGTGQLRNGTLSFREYAQVFEQLSADAVISRERIVIEDFEGRSGGGYIDGRGEIPLRFDNGGRIYFAANFFDMAYPYPAELRPVVQGSVELAGPPEDLLVRGEVEVQSARMTRPVSVETVLLDFRRRFADVKARTEKPEFRVRLDIEVVADGTIEVRNNLGRVEAKGEFRVTGEADRVVLLGSFDVLEGRIDYRGNRYEIQQLTLDFQDPRKNNPEIEGRAETRIGETRFTVSVEGTLEKPEFSFSSEPPLSTNEIVSILALGATPESITTSAGAVSSTEAAAIALTPYMWKMEEGVRGTVGLDKFSIETRYNSTDKTFEPKFTVGKTFGDRFSVEVSSTVGTSAQSAARAEYEVVDDVFLQGNWQSATTDSQGDIGADLKIRYKYRTFRDIFRDRD